jgi:hypothetical protein
LAVTLTCALATVLTGAFTVDLTAPLGAALGAALDTVLGAVLVATLTAAFTLAALLGFFTTAAGLASLALGLDDLLFLFTGIFELVLRGFFTSCLLAVAACLPSKGQQPVANEAWSSAHLRQNPNIQAFGCIRVPIKAPLQGADCSDRSRHKRNLSN